MHEKHKKLKAPPRNKDKEKNHDYIEEREHKRRSLRWKLIATSLARDG